MHFIDTKAILLRYYDYGEADRLFVFFTRDYGKLKLIAKRARRSLKRQFATIDLLSYLELSFKANEERELYPISSIEMIEPFMTLRHDLKALSCALYFVDLIDAFYKVREKDDAMFVDLVTFLTIFEKGGFKLCAIPMFQMKMLRRAGLAPNLDTCINCGEPFEPQPKMKYDFSNIKGGCLCAKCRGGAYDCKLSLGTLKMLRLAQNTPVRDISRISFTRQALRESVTTLGGFITYHLSKSLKSYEYLLSMRIFG